jgi:hypothetical protein
LAGHVTRTGKNRKAYRVLGGMTEGKSPHGRCTCRWENIHNIDILIIYNLIAYVIKRP